MFTNWLEVSLGERSRNGWFVYTFEIMAYGWVKCRRVCFIGVKCCRLRYWAGDFAYKCKGCWDRNE
jgi:hypothetical protein